MPSANIAESALAAFHGLIRLSEKDFESFLDALSRAEPSLEEDNFWKHVAGYVPQIEQALVKSIMDEVFRMENAMDGTDDAIESIAEMITEVWASTDSEKYQSSQADGKILKDRLFRIFHDRRGFNITRKAMGILIDQRNVYLHAKILTDIRPVFNEKGDAVDAAVIVHNLRIHYGQDSDHKDFYVALDTSDIAALRMALDRAEAKAKCLQGLIKKSGVSYLDAEE